MSAHNVPHCLCYDYELFFRSCGLLRYFSKQSNILFLPALDKIGYLKIRLKKDLSHILYRDEKIKETFYRASKQSPSK